MLNSIRENVRQWLSYPQEFRISALKHLELTESVKVTNDLLKQPSIGSQIVSDEEEGLIDMAIDVGTLVWRVQKRLSAMGQLPKELIRVSRDIESTRDALSQRGFEIKDHTGQDYVTGMVLRVIAADPVPELTKKQIIETLKPTIYYKEKIVQMGDVIIGVPEENQTSDLIESA